MELVFPPKAISMLASPTLTFKCKTLARLPLSSTNLTPIFPAKTYSSNSNLILSKTPFPLSGNSPKPSSSWVLNPTAPITSTNALSSTTAETTTVEPDSPSGVLLSTHWIVAMEKPPDGVSSKSDVIDHYVKTLAKVLGRQGFPVAFLLSFFWGFRGLKSEFICGFLFLQ